MAYNAELQMLRELVWLMFGQYNFANCVFCNKRLVEEPKGVNATFGHRRHTKVKALLTIHHVSEDREDNRLSNLVIVHTTCHKAYHKEKYELNHPNGAR